MQPFYLICLLGCLTLAMFYLFYYIQNLNPTILTKPDIIKLTKKGLIDLKSLNQIQDVSVDVYLDNIIKVEVNPGPSVQHSPGLTELELREYNLNYHRYAAEPGEFILARLRERIKLPKNITAMLYLSSGVARGGLQHSIAIPMWPGWEGFLTLELTNNTRFHKLILEKNMKIGTIIFFRHKKVFGYNGKRQKQHSIVGK